MRAANDPIFHQAPAKKARIFVSASNFV